MLNTLNLVVLISGNGSNLQAIIDAIEQGKLNATITQVISNQANAFGLERARKHHLPTTVFPFEKGMTRELYDQKLQDIILKSSPDYILLAGFMRILSPAFIQKFPHKILNIHPSLLPKYPGLNTHERVLAAGDKEHGCTVHWVTEELDAGPILDQARLQVHPDDTVETLKKRVLELEHQLYPKIIASLGNQ